MDREITSFERGGSALYDDPGLAGDLAREDLYGPAPETLAATIALVAPVALGASAGIALAAVGALSFVPAWVGTGALSLDATAILAAAPAVAASVALSVSATGALAAPATIASTAALTISATVALSSPVSLAASAGVSLDGSASLAASPALASSVGLSLSATGALAALAVLESGAGASLDATGALVLGPLWSGVVAAGSPAPRGIGSVSLALPVRRASVSVPSRSVSLALPRRSATAALPVRAVALAITRRFAVADIQGFTQGDRCESSHTLTSTLLGVAQTIAEPLSLVARLYARGSTTLVTSVSVVVADCTGWGTTSVTAPVIYTSEISAALPVGTYSAWLVGTYANGTVRWPENGTSIPLEVRAPGST